MTLPTTRRMAALIVLVVLSLIPAGTLVPAVALVPAATHVGVSSWSENRIDDYAPFFDTGSLDGASCASSGFCAVASSSGRVETSSDPTGGSESWQVHEVGGVGGELDGVACASASLCVAIDALGGAKASTDPGGNSAWTTVVPSSDGGLSAVACFDATRCAATGAVGQVLTSTTPATPGSWTSTDIDGSNALTGVSCPTATMCVAVDSTGNVVTSSNLGSTTPTWRVQQVDTASGFTAVSCPDTSLCVAVDRRGNAFASTNPSATTPTWQQTQALATGETPESISCGSDTLCVAVETGGIVGVSQNPGAASPTWSTSTAYPNSTPKLLEAVSCTQASVCVAADNQGNAVTASNPAQGAVAWSSANVDGTTRLDPGSCPTTSFCAIPDRVGKVLTSSNPANAGADAWTAKRVDGTNQIFGMSCPTSSLCVGVDDVGNAVTSTDPTDGASASWTVTNIDNRRLVGISCATGSSPSPAVMCVAVDFGGDVLTSTDPAGGASAWTTPTSIDANDNLFRIDCPSEQLCVAIDEFGDVITSTNPTGGASTWTLADIDGSNALFSIACHSTALCVAGDQEGNLVSTTNPTGGAAAWNSPVSLGNDSFFGLACGATNQCIAADNAGAIYATTNPAGDASAWSQVDDTKDAFGATGAMCPSPALCVVPSFSSDIAVSTTAAPTVTTGDASVITTASATLNGTVNPDGVTVTDCHFDYGTTTSYGSTAPCAQGPGDGTSDVAVHADITGLTSNTAYHVRLDATAGAEIDGNDVNFTTAAEQPTVTAEAASDVTGQTAQLNGTVNPNGDTVTSCHFDYGTTPQYGTSVPCATNPGGGTSAVAVAASLTDLTPNQPYDFELVATNRGGTSTDTGTFDPAEVDTTITDGPDGPTNIATPIFTFTATPAAGATFMCSIDHAGPTSCASPFTLPSLPDGSHEIEVRAILGGTQDPTPAEQSFFVDTVAPTTSASVAPAPGSGNSQAKNGTYVGAVDLTEHYTDPVPSGGPGGAECSFDPPTVPKSFTDLNGHSCPILVTAAGTHTAYVAGYDAAGNIEATVHSVTFTIAGPPDTTITGGPSGLTYSTLEQFSFTSNDKTATFQCRLDGGTWLTCASPDIVGPVDGIGAHRFQVRAANSGGAVDPTPDERDFQIPQTQTVGDHCSSQALISDGYGLDIDPDGQIVQAHVRCEQPLPEACPRGATCTVTVTANWSDQDPSLDWLIFAQSRPTGSTTWSTSGDCETVDSPHTCAQSASTTLIGAGTAPIMACDAGHSADQSGTNPPYVTKSGPNSGRTISCHGTLTIAPAATLATETSGGDAVVAAPAAGRLTISPGSSSGHSRMQRALSSKHHKPAPPFSTAHEKVNRAGPVKVHLKLSAAARHTLSKKRKLRLVVKETFTVAGSGKTITRTRHITLRLNPLVRTCARKHRHSPKKCTYISPPSPKKDVHRRSDFVASERPQSLPPARRSRR